MDQQTALGILRHLLTILGTSIVAHGYVSSGQWETVVGALVTLAPVVWSVIQKRQQKDTLTAVQLGATNVKSPT